MKHLLTILLLVTLGLFMAPIDSVAQWDSTAFSPTVRECMRALEQDGRWYSIAVGARAEVTPERQVFHRLVRHSTEQELSMLLQHPMPHMRAYAFEAMVLTDHPGTYRAFLEHCQDDTQVEVFQGCYKKRKRFGSFVMHTLFFEPAIPGLDKIPTAEKSTLDSLLMQWQSRDEVRDWPLLSKALLPETHYPTLRRWALIDSACASVSVVARFHQEQDIPFILSVLKKGCRHAEVLDRFEGSTIEKVVVVNDVSFIPHFPHAAFRQLALDELERRRRYSDFGDGMAEAIEAVVCYPDSASLQLLESAIKRPSASSQEQEVAGMAMWAIRRHPHPIFEGLLARYGSYSGWEPSDLHSEKTFMLSLIWAEE